MTETEENDINQETRRRRSYRPRRHGHKVAAMRFQNEHKEQVELLVEEVKECRDALKVMAASGLPPENWSSPDVRIGLA